MKKVAERYIIEHTGDHLYVGFPEPRLVLSSAVLNGGLERADHILNLRVGKNRDGIEGPFESSDVTLENYCRKMGWKGCAVGMMTAADMSSYRKVTRVEQGFIKDLRDQTYEHILWQPLSFFSKYQTGNLMSRITNDINVLNESLKNNFTKIIRDPFMIVIFVTLLISISWQLSLVASIVFPLTGILITKIGQSLKRKSRRATRRRVNREALQGTDTRSDR